MAKVCFRGLACRRPAIVLLHLCLVTASLRGQGVTSNSVDALAADRYTIRVDSGLTALQVEATIRIRSGDLFMHTRGVGDRNYWRRQIRDLSVRDSVGSPLAVDSVGEGRFSVAHGYSGPVTLRYGVDLGFTHLPFASGNQKTGWRTGSALYLVTKPIFILSDTADARLRMVRFQLPAGFKVATPWTSRIDLPDWFEIAGVRDLNHNSIALGRFSLLESRHGSFAMRVAYLDGPLSESRRVERVLDSAANYFIRKFGVPGRSVYLMTFYHADADAGEAFASSSVTTLRVPPEEIGIPMWGNTLAHELFHLWNSSWLRSTPTDSTEWFSEGFTEYYANRAMLSTGLISQEVFLAKANKHLGAYAFWQDRPMFGATLAEAGRDKTRHTFGVYDGGWNVAWCLDVMLRSRPTASSLDDYMRVLFRDFASSQRAYSYSDLMRNAEAMLGPDGRTLFERSVGGSALLPLDRAAHSLGLDLQLSPGSAEAILSRSPTARREEQQRLRRYLSDR